MDLCHRVVHLHPVVHREIDVGVGAIESAGQAAGHHLALAILAGTEFLQWSVSKDLCIVVKILQGRFF